MNVDHQSGNSSISVGVKIQAIAKEEPLHSPTANGFINKYNLGASSTVSTALNKLMATEIVIKDDDKYLVHEVLLAPWLQSL